MEKSKLYHIFCDESRQTADRYMMFGGVIISDENRLRFNEAMALFRESQEMRAELKWTKVSDAKLSEYKVFVDLFFGFANRMHFKSIVIDTSEIDYKRFHKGDKELGFYKFYYQFLLHQFGSYMRNECRYLIHVDQRITKYKLSDLCNILNHGLKKKYPIRNRVVPKIEPVNSKNCDAIQLVDVIMGAIGYQWNDCHTRTNARRAKILLAEYIAQKAGIVSLKQKTPRSKREFSIWHFRFSGNKKTP